MKRLSAPKKKKHHRRRQGREVRVRSARLEDAVAIAALSGELGYPSSASEVRSRLPFVVHCAEHILVVATGSRNTPLGWLHAFVQHQIEADPFVVVVGLVVAKRHRSDGIGSALLAWAEAWAKNHGVKEVRVRSNITRKRAHAFYRRAGYTRKKTSYVFVKEIE